jgi:hypothetical protein
VRIPKEFIVVLSSNSSTIIASLRVGRGTRQFRFVTVQALLYLCMVW